MSCRKPPSSTNTMLTTSLRAFPSRSNKLSLLAPPGTMSTTSTSEAPASTTGVNAAASATGAAGAAGALPSARFARGEDSRNCDCASRAEPRAARAESGFQAGIEATGESWGTDIEKPQPKP